MDAHLGYPNNEQLAPCFTPIACIHLVVDGKDETLVSRHAISSVFYRAQCFMRLHFHEE
jgi:hypothetical protein